MTKDTKTKFIKIVDDELIKELKEISVFDYLLNLKNFINERYFPQEVLGTDLNEKYLIDVIIEYFVYLKLGIKNNFLFWHEHENKTYKQLKEYYLK